MHCDGLGKSDWKTLGRKDESCGSLYSVIGCVNRITSRAHYKQPSATLLFVEEGRIEEGIGALNAGPGPSLNSKKMRSPWRTNKTLAMPFIQALWPMPGQPRGLSFAKVFRTEPDDAFTYKRISLPVPS